MEDQEEITWLLNDKPIEASDNVVIEMGGKKEANKAMLTIKKVTTEHSGTITCRVNIITFKIDVPSIHNPTLIFLPILGVNIFFL